MWKYKLNNNNIEQPSVKNAEDILPKHMSYIYQSNRLQSTHDDPENPNVMCFYAPDGSVFVGIILQETMDSFLVGAAATLRINIERQVISEEVSSQPVLRIMKNSIRYMVLPTEMTIYHYFAFLEEFGYNKLPEYFTEERRDYVTSVRAGSKYGMLRSTDLVPNETKPEVPGDSEHSFTPYSQSESIH